MVRDITVKSTLDYSVHKIAEFKILRGMRRMSSKIKLKIKKKLSKHENSQVKTVSYVVSPNANKKYMRDGKRDRLPENTNKYYLSMHRCC